MNLLPIIRSAQVEDDLIAWLHIARHHDVAADRRLIGSTIGADKLAIVPFSGAPREDSHMVVGEHLTLYRVGESAIEILRVLHGRRRIEADDLKS
jgi:toxin ParE1/3/4